MFILVMYKGRCGLFPVDLVARLDPKLIRPGLLIVLVRCLDRKCWMSAKNNTEQSVQRLALVGTCIFVNNQRSTRGEGR